MHYVLSLFDLILYTAQIHMEVTKTVHSRMKVIKEVQRQWMGRRRKMQAKKTLIKKVVSALCIREAGVCFEEGKILMLSIICFQESCTSFNFVSPW